MKRWVAGTLLLGAAACSSGSRPSRAPEFGPSTTPSAASSSLATHKDTPAAGPPAGASVSFAEDKPLVFQGGAPLTLKPIAKESTIYALSPDGTSWVIEGRGDPTLYSPTLPQGVSFDIGVPSALYSADGSRVMIWGGAGLILAEVATGKVLARHPTAVCGARFVGRDEILLHEESKEADARLLRIRIGAQPVPVGAAREAETCRASLDGKRWFVESYGQRVFLDGETGRTFRVHQEAGREEVVLSAGASRYCQAGRQGMVCTRVPDGRVERVWSRPSSTYLMTFDIEGEHALFAYSAEPEGVYDHFAWVDFAAGTVRRLQGMQTSSGSLFHVHSGGKLVSIGSSSGMHVYDMERGQRRFAAHRPLYGNFDFPYNPRRMVAGTDEPMDLFVVEVR